ncbi:MAG: hypothetical protein AABX23_03390 [Nanoarchaeota archaeon]
MVETILSSPIISEGVLPFILIFTVVFAILQKSKVLGDDKKQIDAMVALVFGLVTITFARAVGIINQLLPFLAVAIIMILVFMILIALFYKNGDGSETKLYGAFKTIMMILAFVAVVIAGLYFTGAWDYLSYKFSEPGSNLVTNIVFIAIIIGGFLVIFFGDKQKKPEGK